MNSNYDSVITALLMLPVLSFVDVSSESATAKKDADFSFPALIAHRAEYELTIEKLCGSDASPSSSSSSSSFPPSLRESCIDVLLRFFNAANFVGDLHEALTIGENLPAGVVRPSLPVGTAGENNTNNTKDNDNISISERLARAAPRIFAHFHCADLDEQPASSFTTSSKTGKLGEADSASQLLPPQPYRLLLRSLTVDGEAIESSVRRGALLAAALALARTLPTMSIWRLRALFRYQLSLTHRVNYIYQSLMDGVLAISQGEIPRSQAPALALEMAQVYAYYHRTDGAQRFLQQAVETSGLQLTEQAVMGVRTRHQVNELPQLVLTAKSQELQDYEKQQQQQLQTMYFEEPIVVQSEASGHDILDRPRAKDASVSPDGAAQLHLRDYAIILALCSHLKMSTAESGGLTARQANIYIERLMIEPDGKVPWALRSMALLLRARFEYGKNRVQERSFMQYQELVDSTVPEGGAKLCAAAFSGWTKGEAEKSNPKRLRSSSSGDEGRAVDELDASAADTQQQQMRLPQRLDRCDPAFHFYSVAWPSRWALRREYGERCFDDNLFKTALELFEQTLDWPNIIKCCKKLDRRNKAASLARDLLKEDPNDVMLWVALGEATRDEQPLFHAWELCNHMMAAPMRALASMALERERYQEVVTYFDQSVRINPIFGGDWFSLGFASMRLKREERASEAFTRVCQIEPDNAYSWVNLGGLLMQKNLFRPAFNAMAQALKHNRGSWRIWDNYFRIGVMIREVQESAHALRIMVKLAGTRGWEAEKGSLQGFATIALQYIRGEIAATGNDLVVDEEQKVDEAAASAGEVTLPSVAGADNLVIPAFPVGATVESEDDPAEAAAAAGLQPLFTGIDDDAIASDGVVYKDAEKQHREIEASLRVRFETRTREFMTSLGGTFVTLPVVHSACAIFFGGLDGPAAELLWRSKQVREEMQQPLWERSKEKLLAVIDAAVHMAKSAAEAEQQLKEQEGKAGGASAAANANGSADERPKKHAMTTLNHIVEKASPHFEDAESEILRPLQVWLMKLKKL